MRTTDKTGQQTRHGHCASQDGGLRGRGEWGVVWEECTKRSCWGVGCVN